VIIGGHRDAWGPGTADNISGTTSVLEAARIVAAEAKAGNRPRRTIVFATWDAEEWGLVGSTEFVEEDSLRLRAHAIAYLNQDAVAGGTSFGGGGSPSLRSLLRDVTKAVPDPAGGTVYGEWRRNSHLAADSLEPESGDPGGGSDFAGFYNHLGIPLADWGFGGAGGVYHSAYDSYHWMTKFGDPTYAYHKTTATIAALFAERLANADIVPLDYEEFAQTMGRLVTSVDSSLSARKWNVSTSVLRSAVDGMRTAATRFDRARDSYLSGRKNPATLTAVNAALIRVERALTRPAGLVTRPWFRGLIYAADEDNGYSTMPFPSINEAIRRNDRALTAAEIADLASRFTSATKELESARSGLNGN
jgi:N-acetylated-alpha-linked acidic dipeptidase